MTRTVLSVLAFVAVLAIAYALGARPSSIEVAVVVLACGAQDIVREVLR